MTSSSDPLPSATPESTDIDLDPLLQMLRRKEQTWVDWGRACQTLQKAGYSPQSIFESTGFEPIQQNQIIVAAQIYGNLEQLSADPTVLDYFAQRRSDILYEFRILSQSDRLKAATLSTEKQLDADEAHLIAKSLRDFSRLSQCPDGFTDAPGDAIAYECWRLARQQADLKERSRLIGRGLQFAASAEARQHLERLLSDFSVVNTQSAPRLPLYRLEQADELPRLLPVVGQWPLTVEDWQTVPSIEPQGIFQIVCHQGPAAWVPLPGWQVVMSAEDPLVFLAHAEQLPLEIPEPHEDLLVVIDRAQRTWSVDGYFLVEEGHQLALTWFVQPPSGSIVGRLLLLVRPPKRLFDESTTENPWLIEE
jgi:hypothetical protein